MFFCRATFTVIALALTSVSVKASHTITLRNNCAWGVDLLLNTWSGPAYTGPAIGNIGAYSSKSIVVDDGWDGRICDTPASSGCSNSCYGSCSMTEFNMNSGGLNWYDISNIQAYTVPQQISTSCGSVTCTSADCPCDQAYRPNDTSGTCGGTGPVDQAVRACGSADFTVTYCP